jgi:ribonuclease BN (tRNA processing enzyme)
MGIDESSPVMELVLLGTGTPNAEVERSGPALAIIVDGRAYLVDCGPGIVRQAAAAHTLGVEALAVDKLSQAFITHLHSDHTAGYPDLILTPWVLERSVPLQVYGPAGLQAMTDHILAAYHADIQERLDGLEPITDLGHLVEVTEIEDDLVYDDGMLRVDACSARHGSWPAFSYRFSAAGRSVVVSGDTAPHERMPTFYAGCDILVHEVYSSAGLQRRPSEWQRYHRAVHTSSRELAEIVRDARPEMLVLTHQLLWGESPESLIAEISAEYTGTIVAGRDLDRFPLFSKQASA